MPRHLFSLSIWIGVFAFVTACQKQEEPPNTAAPSAVVASKPSAATGKEGDEPPPAPPLREDFEGEPKLSLFPRVGDFRPEDSDKEGLSYWLTYIDHLSRISGVLANRDETKGHAFGFRGIKAVDSVGFFSPLAVEPDTSYRVSFRLWSNLSPGGTAGAGILEYDEFLFIPEQFPKTLNAKHFQQSQLGIKLTDVHDGKIQSFSFRTGPKTRMIHLVFFREGTPDREPIVLDDIDIRAE